VTARKPARKPGEWWVERNVGWKTSDGKPVVDFRKWAARVDLNEHGGLIVAVPEKWQAEAIAREGNAREARKRCRRVGK
jgi:hypothetical protein